MKISDHGILSFLTAAVLACAVLGYSPAARADRWDWRNNPERFGGTMVTQLADLPSSGEAATTPWAPVYDPQDAGGETLPQAVRDAGDRYDAVYHLWSPALPGDGEIEPAGPLADYVSGSLDRCATYADLDTDGNGAIDEQEDWGDDETYLLAHDEQEDWGDDEHYFWGLCHSWAAAAILEPEPRSPVLENGVEFSAGELKALLAVEWTRASSRFVGGVCGVGDETLTLDEDGFIIEPECADTNAGGFHVLLTNMLGLDGLSFAVDHDMAAPVRMFPLVSYEVLALTELDAAGANALLGLADESYPFDPDAASFAYVATEVVSVDPDAADSLRTDLYEYLLELDSYGEITGGKWLGDSRTDHPDFAWLPEHDGLDPEIYESELTDDLVLRSQAGDRDGDGLLDGVDSCPDEDASGLDADDDGCVDRVADLADVVLSLSLHQGTERALLASAESAARDEGISAVNKLGAFINKVQAQRGKKIDDDQANLLMSFAAHASAVLQ